jgi:tripartite-type tricarboxylate transporter receptor subunit TctC
LRERGRSGFLAIVLSAMLAGGAACAQSVTFKDRQISMLVGYGPGTGNDLYMRAVQRHLGKHLPGTPEITPVNMPGAASLTMLNYIANASARDGTVIGMPSRNLVTEPLIGNDQARYDGAKLSWIGSVTKDVSVCLTWHASGIRTLEDAKRREVLVGSTGYAADSNTFPFLINDAAGTKLKPLLGYADSGVVGLAMERGELDGYCAFTVSAIKTARPQWISEKQINIIVQIAMSAHPDLPGVPVIAHFARDQRERDLFAFAFGSQEMGRPVMAPPGVPPDRLQALREGFMATMKDPEFLEEARRMGLEVLDPLSGEAVERIVRDLYAKPADIIRAYREVRERRN